MKLPDPRHLSRTLALTTCALLSLFNGCYAGMLDPPATAISVLPRLSTLSAGSSATFTATVVSSTTAPTWTVTDASNTASPGTITPSGGSTTSVIYTAPATPPVYTDAPTSGMAQGVIVLNAGLYAAGASYPTFSDSETMYITSPSISVGLSPALVQVPLGGTQQFLGYAVGGSGPGTVSYTLSGSNAFGGNYGSITANGLYTAPATMPAGGGGVKLTITSNADLSKSASAVITLR